ncbi:MAG: dTDP-4-dehydrorhamnose 3,5-epimerase family protein [Bryobacteraceae bacterium]
MNSPIPSFRASERGLGAIISSPESPDLIAGVRIQPGKIWPDDRGYFLEVARLGQGAVADFPADSTQVSAALSYPGTIKAFHYHRNQTDYWAPVRGMLQVALVDLRPDSPTFGLRNTLYVGELRHWHVVIPPGVGHGYKVIGTEAALLVYLTNRTYDPADEGRIAYNHPEINYDWEIQHK